MFRISRRRFLATCAATALSPAVPQAAESKLIEDPVAFFLIGDTHFLADKESPKKLDPRSASLTTRLVEVLNKLPGSVIPNEAGGGKVQQPRGVIHAGDVIDTGDKNGAVAEVMQQTEWAAFEELFGLTGKDGRLKFPVYEVHGNHDAPRGVGLAVDRIIARNKTRPGVTQVSPNGLHYSWDWGRVHFANLGIVVGQVKEVPRKRRYDPRDSLSFLTADLKEHVGTSGRPVVLTHHVDLQRYALPTPVEDKVAMGKEWDPADVKGFFDALQGHNIAAVLYGHTHARNVFRWDGTAKRAEAGVAVFNVDNSSHFASLAQAFFYFEIHGDRVLVREHQTTDGWQTATWTPQVWSAPLVQRKS